MRFSKVTFGLLFVIIMLFTALSMSVFAQATGPRAYTASPNAGISEASPTVSTITVPEGGTIADLNVVVNIAHTHSGDLRIFLEHESTGVNVTLLRWLNGPGFAYGCGSDGIVATFDDGAGAPMDSYDCSSNFNGVVTGAWQPTTPLAAFNGRDMAGRWTLRIEDTVVSDNGTLNSWGLIFNSNQPADSGGTPATGGGSAADVIGAVIGGGGTLPLCVDYDPNIGSRRDDYIRTRGFNDMFGVHCRTIAQNGVYTRGASEVGNNAVIGLGVIHAVDVYTTNRTEVSGTTVCLRGSGDLIFLNALFSPREPQRLPANNQAGYRCVVIPGQGMLVMVGGSDGVAGGPAPAAPAEPSRPVSVVAGVPLTGCRITTEYMINIRSAPSLDSVVLDMVPYQTTLTATERTEDWFRVVYLDFQGWISADYLTPAGTCAMS